MNIESLNGFDGRRSEKSLILGYVCLFSDASAHLYIAMRGSHWKSPSAPFRRNSQKNDFESILSQWVRSRARADMYCRPPAWKWYVLTLSRSEWFHDFLNSGIFKSHLWPFYRALLILGLCTFDKLVHSIFVRSAFKINAIAIDRFAIGIKKKVSFFVDRSEAKQRST